MFGSEHSHGRENSLPLPEQKGECSLQLQLLLKKWIGVLPKNQLFFSVINRPASVGVHSMTSGTTNKNCVQSEFLFRVMWTNFTDQYGSIISEVFSGWFWGMVLSHGNTLQPCGGWFQQTLGLAGFSWVQGPFCSKASHLHKLQGPYMALQIGSCRSSVFNLSNPRDRRLFLTLHRCHRPVG